MRPPVTVVMCTYNGAEFVAEQLRSILDQLGDGDVLTIRDDGSSDDTLEVIERIIAERSDCGATIDIRSNPTALGAARNFHTAVRAATTDLVLLSDQDDIWYPGHVDLLVQALAHGPAVRIAHTDADLIDAHGTRLSHSLYQALRLSARERARVRAGQAAAVLRRRNIVTGATAGFSRQLARVADPIPGSYLHDEWYGLVAAYHGSVRTLDECTIGYRQHGGNQVGARRHGLRHEIGRMLYPRTERNAILLNRARQLAEHPAFAPGRPGHDDARARLDHELARAEYPAARLARLRPIAREIRTGHYRLVGHGVRDVLRDLLQAP